MTTLIDRILSQIIPAFVDYNLRTKKHIIEYGDTPETFQLAEDRLNIEKQLEYNLRQILEAELTAVNGVDDVCTACYGKKGYSVFHQDNSKDDFTGKDLGKGKTWESLETCPRCNGTGEEPKKPEKPEIMLQPGQYMRDNEGNITTYEDEQKERLKDSQPKVVEIKDTGVNSFKCKCDNIVEYYNKYCGRCGAKIKWIA